MKRRVVALEGGKVIRDDETGGYEGVTQDRVPEGQAEA
jgi:hypothetical protein